MSNYRRLISYIYAYEGGVKGKNIGFAKIEVRNGQCRIHVNVKKVFLGNSDIGVYLLSPKTEILLGRIFIRNGAGEFRTNVNAGNVEGSGCGMEQCYGLTIHETENTWRTYTTIWEDAVAQAAEVELENVTSEKVGALARQEPRHSISEEIQKELEKEAEKQDNTVPEERKAIIWQEEVVPQEEGEVHQEERTEPQGRGTAYEQGRAVQAKERTNWLEEVGKEEKTYLTTEGTASQGNRVVQLEKRMETQKEGGLRQDIGMAPQKETMLQGEKAVPQEEETMSQREGTIPPEETMSQREGTIPQEETMPQREGTIPQEETMPQGEGTIPQEEVMHQGEATILQKEETVNQKEGAVLPGERTMYQVEETVPPEGMIAQRENGRVPPERGPVLQQNGTMTQQSKTVLQQNPLVSDHQIESLKPAENNKQEILGEGSNISEKKEERGSWMQGALADSEWKNAGQPVENQARQNPPPFGTENGNNRQNRVPDKVLKIAKAFMQGKGPETESFLWQKTNPEQAKQEEKIPSVVESAKKTLPEPGNPERLKELDRQDQEENVRGNIWNQLQRRYAKVLAFDYAHECEILSIKPQDIGILPRENWVYGNNSFLLHGYYNYRHLILARLENPEGEPRYLLGVPGHYFNNEKNLASMFGFPHFVLAKKQPEENGRFGYWYTDLRL